MDLTKFIHLCPCRLKKGSLEGISIGKHSGCLTSLLMVPEPSSAQHWIPDEFSLESLKRGVWVMSWSTNCPHCISISVYLSVFVS